MGFLGRRLVVRVSLEFSSGEVVSKDRRLCVPELVGLRAAACLHRWPEAGSEMPGPAAPPRAPCSRAPAGGVASRPGTVEMLQPRSDVTLRLFPTRWPDVVKIRTRHRNLGKQGLLLLPWA